MTTYNIVRVISINVLEGGVEWYGVHYKMLVYYSVHYNLQGPRFIYFFLNSPKSN